MGAWHFQDESTFTLCGGRLRSVICLKSKGKPQKPKDTHSSIRVQIWGVMSADGTSSMERLEGTIKGKDHLALLLKHCSSDGECVVQDNARAHVAKIVRAGLRNIDIDVIQLPARSPDFNPIERVWCRIKDIVYKKNRTYPSLSDLESAIIAAWNTVMADTVYLKSITDDLQPLFTKIIRNGGQYV